MALAALVLERLKRGTKLLNVKTAVGFYILVKADKVHRKIYTADYN